MNSILKNKTTITESKEQTFTPYIHDRSILLPKFYTIVKTKNLVVMTSPNLLILLDGLPVPQGVFNT